MMTNDLSPEELRTLARFDSPTQPVNIDPMVFAKLLSLALVEQKEGGPELTEAGLELVGNPSDIARRPK
jgi:hypothetical protein